jgi:negative regulator of flagellin synthesis FlgM
MRVDGFTQLHGPQGIRPPHHAGQVDRASPAKTGPIAGPVDKVEISPAAEEAIRIAEAAEDRQSLVARIRQQIAAGTYETPEKLNAAVDRLLDQLG